MTFLILRTATKNVIPKNILKETAKVLIGTVENFYLTQNRKVMEKQVNENQKHKRYLRNKQQNGRL